MPPAVAIPLVLGAVSLVATNMSNKSAEKSNDQQQQEALANAKQAYATAQKNMAPWLQTQPAGALTRPSATTGTPTPTAPNTPSPVTPNQVLAALSSGSSNSTNSQQPSISPLIASLIQRSLG